MPNDVREKLRIAINKNIHGYDIYLPETFDKAITAILSVIGEEIEGMKKEVKPWETGDYDIYRQKLHEAENYNDALTDLRARLEK